MRLICPNCGAQYEVDDSVIPDGGRDVQCSNCGHTWFQRPAHMDKALAEELDPGFEPADETPDEARPGKEAVEEDQAAESDNKKPERERRGLDPQVADVLREEAAREAAARRGESAGLETQTELGLDDPGDKAASRSAAARARMARLRGADESSPEAAAAALAAASAPRRELLPDIEEINSSLRASDEHHEAGAETTVPMETVVDVENRPGGFRRGFGLAVLLAVIAVAVYVMAPKIIELVPGSEPYLVEYVAYANQLRASAAEGAATAIAKVKDLIAGVTGG